MRKSIKLIAFLMLAVTFFACKDECADVDCGTFGICNEGTCTCEAGYEAGTDGKCNTERRAKFIGNYRCTLTCGTNPPVSNISSDIVASSANINGIQITNYAGSGSSVVIDCNVDGTDSFTINDTLNVLGVQTVVSGAGTLTTSNTILLQYTSSSNGGSTTCTYIMDKQ